MLQNIAVLLRKNKFIEVKCFNFNKLMNKIKKSKKNGKKYMLVQKIKTELDSWGKYINITQNIADKTANIIFRILVTMGYLSSFLMSVSQSIFLVKL